MKIGRGWIDLIIEKRQLWPFPIKTKKNEQKFDIVIHGVYVLLSMMSMLSHNVRFLLLVLTVEHPVSDGINPKADFSFSTYSDY